MKKIKKAKPSGYDPLDDFGQERQHVIVQFGANWETDASAKEGQNMYSTFNPNALINQR